MAVEIRTIEDSDLAGWLAAFHTGFLRPPDVSAEEVALRREGTDFDRTQGAFDQGRCVATYRSFAQRLTAVGGADVPADAISNVTVLPTHRRRGLLSRMLERDVRAAKERGDVVASLVAAEYPIYGRYGFGPATWITQWRVDVPRAGLDPRYAGPADGGRVDFVDAARVGALGAALHERLRVRQPGVVDRSPRWWQLFTGEVRMPHQPWQTPFHVAYRAPDQPPDGDRIDGLLSYTCEGAWSADLPNSRATVRSLIAATPAAERALWHYLLSVDWITEVLTDRRPPDDLLPLLLADPRAARVVAHSDFLWLRPLDVPRLLQARSYPVSDALVIQLRDRAGLVPGRYLLRAGPDGVECGPTTRSAELAMDVGELATLWLGDESAVRLAALGRIEEQRAGAAARADLLFRTPRRPWCPDLF